MNYFIPLIESHNKYLVHDHAISLDDHTWEMHSFCSVEGIRTEHEWIIEKYVHTYTRFDYTRTVPFLTVERHNGTIEQHQLSRDQVIGRSIAKAASELTGIIREFRNQGDFDEFKVTKSFLNSAIEEFRAFHLELRNNYRYYYQRKGTVFDTDVHPDFYERCIVNVHRALSWLARKCHEHKDWQYNALLCLKTTVLPHDMSREILSFLIPPKGV